MDDASGPVGAPLDAFASLQESTEVKGDAKGGAPAQQSKKRILLAAGLVGAGVVAVVGWILLRPIEVVVLTLFPQPVEIALSVVGRVQSRDTLEIRSKNAGQVAQLLHDEGDIVVKGAPLAVISSDVESAEATAASAREQAARAQFALTQLALTRAETLAAKGAVSSAALDNAKAAAKSAQAAMVAATSDRRAASARLGEFIVRAPMAGVVLLRPVDNGQVITPATTLFQLGSASGREIDAEVDEAFADDLRPGMAARAAPSGSSVIFAAHIREISPRVDPATGGRTITLLPDAGTALPPGRTVDVTVVIGVRPDALVVPREAILESGANPHVYVVDSKGMVNVRPIKIDAWPSLNAIVTGGVSAGDKIVLIPSQTRPSARVRPLETKAPLPAPGG